MPSVTVSTSALGAAVPEEMILSEAVEAASAVSKNLLTRLSSSDNSTTCR